MKRIKYTIEKEGEEYVLYSHVATNFGGDAKNYVCSSQQREVVQGIADSYKWVEKEDD